MSNRDFNFFLRFQSCHITVNDSLKLIEINPINFNHAEVIQDPACCREWTKKTTPAHEEHFNLRILYEKSIQQPDDKYVPYDLVFVRLSKSMAELLKEEFRQLYTYIVNCPYNKILDNFLHKLFEDHQKNGKVSKDVFTALMKSISGKKIKVFFKNGLTSAG